MSKSALELALERAKDVPVTADDRERQRRSFAYGNVKLAYENLTPEMVDEVADESPDPA